MGRVDELIRELEEGESTYERVEAAEALGKLGKRASPKVLDALHNALDDTEAWLRYAAVVALGKIGTEDAIESLIYALENDEEAEIRFTAAQKLYELGAKSAWSTFKRILDVEQSHEIQEIAVRALGKWGYGKPDVVDKLIAILESYLDYDEKVRAAAAESLGKLDDPYALHALFRAGETTVPTLFGRLRGKHITHCFSAVSTIFSDSPNKNDTNWGESCKMLSANIL